MSNWVFFVSSYVYTSVKIELVDSNCFLPLGFSSAGVDEDLLSLTSLIEGDVDAVDSNEESGDLPNLGEDTEEPELLAISNSDDTKSEGKTQNQVWSLT